ncbi:MAG TPA: EscN/YscN/HrcN family type III secretion system ATPase [Candidatus Cybelea sp.]
MTTTPHALDLGTCALGRAIDAFGAPLDGGPALRGLRVALEPRAPLPNERAPVGVPLWTGIRVVDALLTIGRGARVGIFGAPGSGKSVFVETIVSGCAADAAVVALVGERGREAQRWIALRGDRTTIVCATSDRAAHERVAACRIALAHARALRDRGLDVVVIVDSLARVAAALREIRSGAGESTGRGGFPPSVFAELARLIEVAGQLHAGSITLFATVLSDGDDRDPVSEAARSLLDGHIALSTRLAHSGRFPAVDVLNSTSRTMEGVAVERHLHAAWRLRRAIALLDRVDDARTLGIEPVDRAGRAAVAAESRIEGFLRQAVGGSAADATLSLLFEIAALLGDVDADR